MDVKLGDAGTPFAIQFHICIARDSVPATHRTITMPISLRLPSDIESQITGFGARQGLSKSAVIVRSIQEFLARNAEPTSHQIYQEAMGAAVRDDARRTLNADTAHSAAEVRPHKIQVREAIRRKHAKRAARSDTAVTAIGAPQRDASDGSISPKPRVPLEPSEPRQPRQPRQPRKVA